MLPLTPMMTDTNLLDLLRDACETAGSQRAWADGHGLSTAYVCDVLGGRRQPGKKVLDALGCERVTRYREKQPRERDGE